jgi:hypothetical protein
MLSDHILESVDSIARDIVVFSCDEDDFYEPDVLAHCIDGMFALSAFVAVCDSWESTIDDIKVRTQLNVLSALCRACEEEVDGSCAFRMLYRVFPAIRDAVLQVAPHTVKEHLKERLKNLREMSEKLTDEDRAIAALATEPLRYVGDAQEQQAA